MRDKRRSLRKNGERDEYDSGARCNIIAQIVASERLPRYFLLMLTRNSFASEKATVQIVALIDTNGLKQNEQDGCGLWDRRPP